jgi:hypothetical protein
MKFTWVLTEVELREILDLAFDQQLTPDEIIEDLHLTSHRQYFVAPDPDNITILTEEQAFELEQIMTKDEE